VRIQPGDQIVVNPDGEELSFLLFVAREGVRPS
jgi:hypothetical protein